MPAAGWRRAGVTSIEEVDQRGGLAGHVSRGHGDQPDRDGVVPLGDHRRERAGRGRALVDAEDHFTGAQGVGGEDTTVEDQVRGEGE